MKQLFSFALMMLITISSYCQLSTHSGIFSDKYYNGNKQVSRKDFESIIKKNERAYDIYKDGKAYDIAGSIFGLAGSISFLAATLTKDKYTLNELGYAQFVDNRSKRKNLYYTAAGSYTAALVCYLIGDSVKKKGIQAANEGMGFKISI